jgi:hypothetical protein
MKEVVIVTATDERAELLYLCLEAIRRDDNEITVCVFVDRSNGCVDLRSAAEKFKALVSDCKRENRSYGNSFNTLDACNWAVNYRDFEIVHLIEDDTLIHKGYFSWARESLKRCEVACARIDSPHIPNWYESPCVSWNATFLRRALEHVVPEYFSSDRLVMQRVLDEKMFPASAYKKGGAEQDGFFLRCIEHHGWKTKFPPKPMATHLGWWGYNSPPGRERPTGSFAERIAQCRAMLTNVQRRKELFGHRITEAEMSGWDGKT